LICEGIIKLEKILFEKIIYRSPKVILSIVLYLKSPLTQSEVEKFTNISQVTMRNTIKLLKLKKKRIKTTIRERIIDYLLKHGKSTTRDIALYIKSHKKVIATVLCRMTKKDEIIVDKTYHAYLYELKEK